MTFSTKDLPESLLESIGRIDYIKIEDIPGIDLYMDQVTTFMERQLSDTKRREDDKILTKTMINNYAKNNLLPPPNKKKYSRQHILLLIFIYYFKNIMSISDIEKLLSPLKERYFGKKSELSLEEIYEKVCTLSMQQVGDLEQFVSEHIEGCRSAFEGADGEDDKFLQLFSFICALSFDVYTKKLMIEKLIDMLPDERGQS